jgi:LytS/YehU family sensor histidine kinase
MLSNELEALKIYIEMEGLRFNDKFTYQISIEEGIYPEMMEVPPLIIQPYVENAIWHGLLHKEASGHLQINLTLIGDNVLQCVIEDDGVGRDKAKEYKSKSVTTRKSLGMKLTEDRISILNKYASLNASVQIIDLVDNNGVAAGTRVILKIPV